MTEVNFEPGTPVCYKCGSPTFLVLKTKPDNQTLILSWFDTSTNKPKTFKVSKVLIETLEDFHIRKIRMEAACNKRVYEIPPEMDPDNVLTIGFLNAEHKDAFMEKMFTEKADGHVFSKDPKYKMN